MTDQPAETPESAEIAEWLDAVRVDGRLQIRVPLSVLPWTFYTGGKQELLLEVDGEPKTLVVTIPAGTRPGQALRLRDVALGDERADVYVELKGLAIEPQTLLVAAGAVGALVVGVVTFFLAAAGGA